MTLDLSDESINAMAYYFAYKMTDEEREEHFLKPIRDALNEESALAKLFNEGMRR